MKRTLTTVFAVGFALLVLGQTALAIPAFARKHGFNCNMCHVAFPKLNDFGQRFRDNGYQIPGQQGLEKTVFESPFPLAFRTTTGLQPLRHRAGRRRAASISIIWTFWPAASCTRTSPTCSSTRRASTSRPPTSTARARGTIPPSSRPSNRPTSSSATSSGTSSTCASAASSRASSCSAPSGFTTSCSRSRSTNFAGTRNSFDFSANQIGIEATGRFKPGLKYALGYVNGTGANPDNNKFNDLYLALSKTFGKGEGQSAGQRIGVFGYLGWQPTNFVIPIVSPVGDTNGADNRTYYRVGGDISLNWKTFNLQGMAFRGVDNRAFNDLEPTLNYAFWGGVVQLDWAGLPNNRLVGSLMYNWVRPPCYNGVHKVDAYSALVRYYLGSWSAVNVSIHAEFTRREAGSVSPIRENLFTLLLDFDF